MMNATATMDVNPSTLDAEMMATGLREKHVRAFAGSLQDPPTPEQYFDMCVKSGNAKMSKVSMQSECGYLSRRAKIASAMTTMDVGSGLGLSEVTSTSHSEAGREECTYVPIGSSGGFGNPCIRAISKCTSNLMQGMLTVKTATANSPSSIGSKGSDSAVSPVMDFLMGSVNTLVMYQADGEVGASPLVLRNVKSRDSRQWMGARGAADSSPIMGEKKKCTAVTML